MRPNKIKSLNRLIKLTSPHINKIFLAALCVLVVNAAQLSKPYILKLVIDDFLVNHIPQKGLYTVVYMWLLYFLVVALGTAFSIIQVNLINKVGQQIIKDLRSRVFKTILLMPLTYLDKNSSGRLITRATNDVDSLSEMYTYVIINLFKDVFLLIGIVYFMVTLNYKLAFISFSLVPVMFIIIFSLKKKIKQNFSTMKSLIGKINGFMAENISGMRLVQIFRAEKEKKQEFSQLNTEYFNSNIFQVRLNSLLRPASDVFQNLSVALILWYSIGKIGDHTLEIGVLYAFTTYIKQFFNPIADLADNYTTIQSALISSDRIFELLDQEDITEDLIGGVSIEHLEGNIQFKNVWFSYNDNNWILKDLSFNIKKGETVAFVGETGAGKTTILSLISGFYKVQKGEILIDGVNIDSINKKHLRKNVAVILQDVFLFAGNIEKNITLNDNISEKQVRAALEISYASDFINAMPDGINEPVMERGNTLSAGERQLLAFARAIAHNPSIFALDEATANIDTQTEQLIQKAISNITKEKTTLIIAHRLSTIKAADKIIVLSKGEIVEIGSHHELRGSHSYYNRLLESNSL